MRITSPRAWMMAVAVTICACFLLSASAFASFGVNSVSATATNRDGSVDLRAGSHPYEYKVSFAINHNSSGKIEGTMRDLVVDLPPGLIGDPQAVPRCSGADFEGLLPSCPGNTQIGRLEVKAEGLPVVFTAVYNLVPPFGVAANLGTSIFSINSFQEGSLRTSDYGLSISDVTLPTNIKIQSVTERIWGTPPDPAHDAQRECRSPEGGIVQGCPSDTAPVPFLTLPTSCTGPLQSTVSVHSLEEPDVLRSETVESLDDGGNPAGLNNCEQPPFSPTLSAQPETSASGSPTGLHVGLHIPQNQDSQQLASAHLKSAVVTLPKGLTVNPSTADGLQACPLQGPEGINLPGSEEPAASEPARCPAASKVGTVQVHSPLLDHPLPGAIYLARQNENPFGSLIALYVAVDDPVTGVVVKLAGKVEPDPVTGQLKASFPNNPQLPFEDLTLDFFGGPRAALTTPSTCGTYTTTSDLTPWTSPAGADASPSDSFLVDSGCGGGFSPSFSAGAVNNQAGGFSPFTATFSRGDQDQNLAGVALTTPPGLLGILKSVVQCPEPQASQGTCGAGSLVGHTSVAVGSGPDPFYVRGGQVFLTGPYKGAPFGFSIVVPAVAGPFDLGNVVVRAAINVDPHTAQITVTSDPLPTILQGIPLDVRTVNVTIDRAGFTFNPTNCEPLSVSGMLTSTQGATANVSSRFQAANCANLGFHPSFTVATQATTSKKNGASLDVKVGYPTGSQANIRSVAVTLPKQLPARLTTIQQACPEATFKANPASCPAGSNIGIGTASTPVLANSLTGPAYLVSHGGAAFPDLVLILQGEGITLDLVGSINIKKSITSSTFASIPDAPISSFELKLPEGPHSGLTAVVPAKAKGNLCGQTLTMPTTLTGQNGATVKQNTKITITGCTKTKKKAKKKKHRKAKKHRSA